MNKKYFLKRVSSVLLVALISCIGVFAKPPGPGDKNDNNGNSGAPPANSNIAQENLAKKQHFIIPFGGNIPSPTLPSFISVTNKFSLNSNLNNVQHKDHQLPISIINIQPSLQDIGICYGSSKPIPHQRRGISLDTKKIAEKLGNYDANNSPGYKKIVSYFGRNICSKELLSIINTLTSILNTEHGITLPRLTREHKKSLKLLKKYVDENSELILPYLNLLT